MTGGRPRVVVYNDLADMAGGAERGAADLLLHLHGRLETSFASHAGGALADGLAAAGLAVHQLQGPPTLHLPRHTLYHQPGRVWAFAGALREAGRTLAAHVREQDAALLYTFSLKGHLVGLAAASRHEARAVWDLRELAVPDVVLAPLLLRAQGSVDRLLVQTTDAARRVARWFPAERVVHVPNGVDVPALAPDTRVRVRARLGIAPDAFLILHAGRQCPDKGLDVLLAAMHEVGPAVLVACGTPRTAHDVRFAAQCARAAASLGDRVRLLGERHDVTALLAAADLAVVPARADQQSRFLLEALAAGTPAVATALPGAIEVVEPPTAGLVVPPGDARALARAIETLRTDAPRRASMGAVGRSRVARRFSREQSVTARAALLETVALAPRPGGARSMAVEVG